MLSTEKSSNFYAENNSQREDSPYRCMSSSGMQRSMLAHRPNRKSVQRLQTHSFDGFILRRQEDERSTLILLYGMQARRGTEEVLHSRRTEKISRILSEVQKPRPSPSKGESCPEKERSHCLLLKPDDGMRLLRHSRITIPHDRSHRWTGCEAQKRDVQGKTERKFGHGHYLAHPEQLPSRIPGSLLQLQLRERYEGVLPA